MNGDNTTRLLLLAILVCLVVLVFQGRGGDDGPALWGRYQVIGTRAGAPLLIRTDTRTGTVWKLELRGGDGRWVAFEEPREPEPESESQAAREPEAPEPPAARSAPPAAEPGREPPAQGPRINFARRPPPPAAPSTPRESAPLDLESITTAIMREDLPPEIRIWAVNELADSDDPGSTDVLLEALRAQDPEVSAAAAEALEGRDDPRIDEALDRASER